MTKSGYIEAIRRGATLLLLTTALVQFRYSNFETGSAFLAAALAAYLFLPRVKPPAEAMVYSRVTAVIMPDFLGFMLTSVFLALPFCIGIPGAAFMFLPMALVSGLILVFSSWYACFYLLMEPDYMVLSTPMKERRIPFGNIDRAAPYKRGLPKWMRKLAPFLAFAGHFTAAGSIMVARDETGIELFFEGDSQRIPEAGFEKHYKQLLKVLAEKRVKMEGISGKRR